MIAESASEPARDGPYGTKPARVIVERLTETLTIRPGRSSSMRGTTALARRK